MTAVAATTGVVITAYGIPAPQGSKLRTRFGLVDDNAKTLKPWRRTVAAAAIAARPAEWPGPYAGPVIVETTITLPRPAAHYRTGRFAHLLRDDAPGWPIARGVGDSDKYARGVCDALTIAETWVDDVLVVEHTIRKVYVGSGIDALDRPGALIRIWPVP